MTEHEIQKQVVQWFRLQYPNKIIFAIPNGGHRHIATARKLKSEGVLAGVPDLFIPEPCGGHNGLFIEMKKPKGKATTQQQKMIFELRNRGYWAEVCKSFDEAENLINFYFS